MIDIKFLQKLEGYKTKGYVPRDTDGGRNESGVTIGTGIDLGYRTAEELQGLALSKELLDKLLPFVGLRGRVAKQKLTEQPLILTDEEVVVLDLAMITSLASQLIAKFNAVSLTPFEKLRGEFQTVIYSVFHQYGPIWRRTPRFWRLVTSSRFADVLNELRNFGDAYATRRNLEADLWERGLIAWNLHNQ